jgi:hypothetical protein
MATINPDFAVGYVNRSVTRSWNDFMTQKCRIVEIEREISESDRVIGELTVAHSI